MNSLTEAKQNRMFAIFQRTNYRPSAVSLIHLLWLGILDYARQRKQWFRLNLPRLTLPREHSNATTKAYALPRDWSVQMGDDEVNHIVRLHRERRFTRSWRLKLLVRPTRSGSLRPQSIQLNQKTQVFLLHSHLGFKWIFIPWSFLEE